MNAEEVRVKWQRAFCWLRDEAKRHCYTVTEVVENKVTHEIAGRLCKTTEWLDFSIHTHRHKGMPEVYVFLSIDPQYAKPYRVYHEFAFSKEAVFPLRRMLGATTHDEADKWAWFGKQKTVNAPFEFYVTFLKQELLEAGVQNAATIREVMKPYTDAIRKRRQRVYAQRPMKSPPPPNATADYGPVAATLMAKMGYKEGMGLGKAMDGIREPIAPTVSQNKMGLGYTKRRRRKRNPVT
jgi:hypothetical protein